MAVVIVDRNVGQRLSGGKNTLPVPLISLSPSISAIPFPTSTPEAISPIITPIPSESPAPTISGPSQLIPESSYSISFVGLPQSVAADTPFVVSWRVEGPSNAVVDLTTLKASYKADEPNSSVSSRTRQSFGPFTVPKTFSAQLQYGPGPGTVELEATATVTGQMITASQTVHVQ